jgi:hypothetical protein
MVDQVKKASKITVRKIENAYAVLALVCTAAAAIKVATLPQVHAQVGSLPVWQVVAGILLAGQLYVLFHLIDGQDN